MPVLDVLNYQNTPIYDTYEVAKAASFAAKVVFFADPMSATKGLANTNMRRGYQLPNPENFEVRALRFVPIDMDDADLIKIMQKYVCQLIVSGKTLLEAPLEYFAGGAGVAGFTTSTDTQHVSNGAADPRAIAALDPRHYIKIESGETFSVELNGTSFTATEAIFLRCYLDGIWGKAVS